ncbi:hypothetical protein K437DRAFT_2118 [Tilletiaria anomala UBC 951]|uniref:Uncharacterized protein n=1 Tax=Tilletiaria anomala (strain ATCC 24038 / CBS 436.72 / UBC 951) TaxID=1037660 RepID=A0A066WS98_TILAU|nr:uncharacterized protein K437DRAFT_2118 [Tilletiaria anomala UBC 951]KDN53565.1 hypothetical protein K437DRAFT_2118 [Tilletiaria anomala UBC 951]
MECKRNSKFKAIKRQRREHAPFKLSLEVLSVREPMQLLTPLNKSEVNTIRCIGLIHTDVAKEAKLDLPDRITLLHKPRTIASISDHSQIRPGRPIFLRESPCGSIREDCKSLWDEYTNAFIR